MMIALPIYFQMVFEYTAMQTGLSIAPFSLSIFLIALLAGRKAGKRRPARIIQIGFAATLIGVALMLPFIPRADSGLSFFIPLVIAGSGVDRSGANAALLAIVERLGCPVLPTMAGRSVVPTDHPSAVYGFGAGGDLAKREADVVLVAGSRLGNLDLPFDKYWGDPASQRVVQIDVDPRDIGVTRPLALAVVADARIALEGLARVLAAGGSAPKTRPFSGAAARRP